MIYWIKKLQTQLGIEATGIFDDATFDSVKNISHPTPPIMRILQEFLNRIGRTQLEVNGKFDNETQQMLTFFQKEYGYKLNVKITEYSRLNESTWVLIRKYCVDKNLVVLNEHR